MDDVITVAANLSTKGFEKGSKALQRAVNSLSKTAQQFGRATERSARTAIGSVKRLIPMILGVGSAYGIISKAVSAFMSQNEQLSSKMNSIWTALGNVLGPIITQIINWVTTAVSYFLEFLRLLGITGKTASELSKKASGSAGQLQRTIAGFDELNVLNDSSGNGGATLDDVDPSEWMKKLADLLKNKMWDDAADLIIQKMNEIIYMIRDKAYEVGEKIGEYLQGIIHVIARVLDEVDWKQLGVGIANFVNGLLKEIEGINLGEDLGKILVAKFTIGFKILTGFLETLDLGRIADILSGIVIGAFDAVGRAIAEADFRKIGENIRLFFERLWGHKDEIKAAIYGALEAAWNAALDLLRGLFDVSEGEEDPPLIKSIIKVKETLVNEVIPAISDFVSVAWEQYLKPVLEWAVDTGLPKLLEDLADTLRDLTAALKDGDWSGFKDGLNGLEKALLAIGAVKLVGGIAGATKGIKDFLAAIGIGGAKSGITAAANEASTAIAGAGGTGGLAGAFSTLGTAVGVGGAASLGVGLAMLVAHFGSIPLEAYEAERATKYLAQALEGTDGTVQSLASTMNEMAETASYYNDFLYDSTGYTMDYGFTMQDCADAANALTAAKAILAEQLGYTGEEFARQLEMADGDYVKMLELKDANDQLIVTMTNEGKTIQEIADTLGLSTEYIQKQVDANVTLADATGDAAKKGTDLANATGEAAKKGTELANANRDVKAATEQANQGLQSTKQEAENTAKVYSEKADEMANTTSEKWEEIENESEELGEKLKETFDSVTEDMAKSLSKNESDVKKHFASVSRTVEGKMREIETRIMSSLSSISGRTMSQLNALSRNVSSVLSQVSYSAYYWGADLGANFANGIYSRIGSIIAACSYVASTVRSYLGFSEPEKGPLSDFHTYGPDMMKLYASGIDEESDTVIKSISSVAKGVAEVFDGANLNIGENLQALNDIGANVNFRVPAVASGSVVPYGVETNPSSGMDFGGVFSQQLYNAVYDAMMNANGSRGSSGSSVVLSINGREFMRAVYNDQQAVAREHGVSLVTNA